MAAGLNETQHAEIARILGQRDADIGQALRAEIATVAGGVATLQRDTAGVVEEIAKASRDFATQQQLVVNTLDAKATELNDKKTAIEAAILKFYEDGRTLGERVDAGQKLLKDQANSQMAIVVGEFEKFQQKADARMVQLEAAAAVNMADMQEAARRITALAANASSGAADTTTRSAATGDGMAGGNDAWTAYIAGSGAATSVGGAEAGAGAGSGVGAGAGAGAPPGKYMGLCDRKDLEIAKLHPEMARDDFLLWRDTVGDFLQEIPGWKGISITFEKLQQSRVDATSTRVAEMAGASVDAVAEKSKTL